MYSQNLNKTWTRQHEQYTWQYQYTQHLSEEHEHSEESQRDNGNNIYEEHKYSKALERNNGNVP